GGIYLGTSAINNGSTQLYSAGGNITARGKTNSGALVTWATAITTPGGLTVDAGAGKIMFDAWMNGSSIGGPMEFNAWSGTTSYKSTSTADDSIKFMVHSTTKVTNMWGANAGTTLTNTNGGGVLIQADGIEDSLKVQFNTTGKVAVEPYGGTSWVTTPNFDSDYSFVTNNPSLVRFGKDGATGTVNVGGAISIPAPTEVYGTDVTTNGNLTVSTSGSKLLLKSTNGITTSAGTAGTLQTNNGPITLWSDSDKSAGGNIFINTSTTIKSQGGNITLAGGLDDGGTDSGLTTAAGYLTRTSGDGIPDGYAKGTATGADSTGSDGIYIGGSHLIYSAGGNIFMAGWGSSRTNPAVQETGIQSFNGTVDSGTGLLYAVGKANGTACGSHGIYTNAVGAGTTNPDVWTSANTTANAIRMLGDASAATGSCDRGIVAWNYSANQGTTLYQGFRVLATGTGGGVTLTGYGANNTGNANNDGLDLNFTDILAISGPITLNGSTPTAAGDSTAGVAIGKYGNGANTVRLGGFPTYSYTNQAGTATSFATSSSNITINTDRMWTQYSVVGTAFNTTGTVSILPIEQSFDQTSTASGWDYANFAFASTVSGFQLGKSGTASTQSIKPTSILSNVTIAGPVSLYGSNVTTSGSVSTSSDSSNITIQATGTATTSATLSTTGATSNVSISGTNLSTYTITATGNIALTGSGTVTSTQALTASGTGSTITTSGTTMSSAAMTANAGISITGTAGVTASGTLTTNGTVSPVTITGTNLSVAAITSTGDVSLTGSGTVTASGTVAASGTGEVVSASGTTMSFAAVSGNSGITIAGTAGTTVTGALTTTASTAPISVSGTSVSTATTSSSSTVVLRSTSTTLATGAITSVGNVTLTGATTVTGSAAISVTGTGSTFTSTGTTMSFTTISAVAGISVTGTANATTTTLTTTGTLAPVSVSGVNVQTAGITATGNITLTGTGTVTSTAAVNASGTGATFAATGTAMDFTSVSGNAGVSIVGSSTNSVSGTITTTKALSPVTVSGTTVGVVAVTSTGDVTLSGTSTVTATGTVTASGAGKTVSATGTVLSFVAVSADGGINLDASSTNTVTGAITTTGTLATVTVDGTSVKTAAIASTGDVLLKGSADVIANGAIAVSGTGEFVKIWADSDNSGSAGGGAWTKSTVTTTGGAIIISGGTDLLTGCARGMAATGYWGVQIDGNITSAGGDVTICGEEAPNGGNIGGVSLTATISSGAGNVNLTGKLNALNSDTSYWHVGIEFGNNSVGGSIATTTGNITVLGTANGNTYVNHRGILVWPWSITSTSGAISITGLGATGSASNNWDIQMGSAGNVVSSGGAVSINGSTATGLQFVNQTITSTTSITLTAPKLTFSATKVTGAAPVLI
ncbi:MAG: hypothetical protein ORN27_08285, partial [Rhodoluna sp.]|nr:hypothetical protein [Rhodoluna sp.]